MKIFDKTQSTQQAIEAVNSESHILATCAMPNVVRAFERFETKNNIYLIMELIEGGSLFQYISKEDRKNLK
jgi:serine/threonine protein kinase